MRKSAFLLLVPLLLILFKGFSQSSVEGIWKSEDGTYMMKIATIGSEVQGRIVWMQQEKDENGKPKLDVKNPDEKLRKLPIKGSKILKDLKFNSATKNWEGGTIYLPEEGKSYKCNIAMKGNTMAINYKTADGTSKSWRWTKSN